MNILKGNWLDWSEAQQSTVGKISGKASSPQHWCYGAAPGLRMHKTAGVSCKECWDGVQDMDGNVELENEDKTVKVLGNQEEVGSEV